MITISDLKEEYGISMALVILCTRIHFKTAEISELNAFLTSNDILWVNVFKTCRKHQICPLIYKILLKTNLDSTILKQISYQLNLITLKSFEQAKETERIIFLLKKNNISVIPYKGTAFSKQFFGNISMRQSSDIDLVINSDDIPKAIKIFEKDGFIPYQKEYYYWIGHKNFINKHKDFSFDKHIGTTRIHHVELHFKIITQNTHLPDYSNIFDKTNPSKCLLFQKEIDCLHPIIHYRAIALHHMLMDQMGYLKTVVDLCQILNHSDIIKKQNEINSSELFAINQLHENFDFTIIYEIIKDLIGIQFNESKKTKTTNNFTRRILESTYRKVREEKKPLLSTFSYNYKQIKFTSSFYRKRNDKLLYFLKKIISITYPQPDDYLAIRLNKKLYFLYYFVRPFRILFFQNNPSKK